MGTWARREALAEQVCRVCGARSGLIGAQLGVCLACIRRYPERALEVAQRAHAAARRLFELPEAPPRTPGGVRCRRCAQACTLGEGERGFCGLRVVRGGRLRHLAGTPRRGLLHPYRDPLPTNCVADPFCRGHAQRGRHNLAVFYAACTFDCLNCQNWHFREVAPDRPAAARTALARALTLSAEELAALATPRTHCVCFFGGDPAAQMGHALEAGRKLARRGVAVCWETNGSAHPHLMARALDLALASGGCVKFDLKAHDEVLHGALTGSGNRQTLENFRQAAARIRERPDPPPLVASTLLVPGYVDAEEVGRIARFIAALDPAIPYVLLGFAPQFLLPDLPPTSQRHAEEAEAAARAAGLTRVVIGNRGLLSQEY
jgi:pyruvate formate lyase activating enzyme